MGDIIKVDFEGRSSESKYYQLDADEPHLPVIVSVHPEGVEILQYDNDEMVEVFITDEQLGLILLLLSQQEEETPSVH